MRDPNILSEDINKTPTDRTCNDTCKDQVI